jgi:hypothetical protein
MDGGVKEQRVRHPLLAGVFFPAVQDPTPRYYVRDPVADVVLLSSSLLSCIATLVVVGSYFRYVRLVPSAAHPRTHSSRTHSPW